jgi:hypothetical protein
LTHVAPRQNFGLDDARGKMHDEQMCPIGEALYRANVPQQDDWYAHFQPKPGGFMEFKSSVG